MSEDNIEQKMEYFPALGKGNSLAEAEASLVEYVDNARNDYGINLELDPKKNYTVFVKADENSKVNIDATDITYQGAIDALVETLGEDITDKVNQVIIFADYPLTKEEEAKVDMKEEPTKSYAGSSSKTLTGLF
ncbi:hypothetical protein C0585_07165 [Candidatus Woesearchaeota archaeon]|nr:MAG: hypothetical protein C0585_07165 [Candidatus Woesearchaeota archaeon]